MQQCEANANSSNKSMFQLSFVTSSHVQLPFFLYLHVAKLVPLIILHLKNLAYGHIFTFICILVGNLIKFIHQCR